MGDVTPSLDDLIATHLPKLVRLLDSSTLSELELSLGDLKVTLRRTAEAHGVPQSVHVNVPTHANAAPDLSTLPEDSEGQPVIAPMVGTFYSSPSPGSAPFVREGDEIEPGQVIGVIEAMKVMNEIEADVGGRIRRIVVQNQQTVEYGQTLMFVAPD